MNGPSRFPVFRSLAEMCLRYPISFFKSISIDNLIALRHAVKNETPSGIVENIQSYFRDISAVSPSHSRIINDRFFRRVAALDLEKQIVLFVSHEATRTGAPKVILKIAQQLQKRFQIQPIFILCRGGIMQREFADHFPTYILDGINGSFSDAKKMDRFLNKLTVLTPLRKSLVNSAESRNILPHLRKNGVEKVIYLIHEMGNTAEENAWSIINQMSDEVIFPASVVMSKALTNSNFDLAKLHVISQGLLNEAIYSFDPEVSRIFLQKELQLPTNAKIVLGCGQAIKRKGPDLFVLTAFGVLQRYTGSEPVYFIWMGEEPKRAMDLWLNRDIELSGFRDRIRFIGPREDVNHYFVGSDIFFLTSRSDPHPCVVHEATAAGLPIVGFENTGGVVGMVYQENADIVPYADIHCASEKILQHLYNPSLAQQNRERTVRFARENLDFSTYTDEIYRLMED